MLVLVLIYYMLNTFSLALSRSQTDVSSEVCEAVSLPPPPPPLPLPPDVAVVVVAVVVLWW